MSRRLKLEAIKRIAAGKSSPSEEFPKSDSDKPWKLIYQKSDDASANLFYEDEDGKILSVDEVEKSGGEFNLMIFQIVTCANKHLFDTHFHIARMGSLPAPRWRIKPNLSIPSDS